MSGDGIELLPKHPLEKVVNAAAHCKGDARFVQEAPRNMTVAERETLRSVCLGCPVRAECRVVGDYIESHVYVSRSVGLLWGGEFPNERFRRRAGRAA
jgi:hypothetical protein